MRFSGTGDHTSGLPSTTPTSSSLSRMGSQLSVPQSLRAGTTATLFLQQSPVHRHGEGGAWIHRLWVFPVEHSHATPLPPASGVQAQSSVIQGLWGNYSPLSCPSFVDWGSRNAGRAESWLSFPDQPSHSTSVRAHGSPAVSGPGSCAKCMCREWA